MNQTLSQILKSINTSDRCHYQKCLHILKNILVVEAARGHKALYLTAEYGYFGDYVINSDLGSFMLVKAITAHIRPPAAECLERLEQLIAFFRKEGLDVSLYSYYENNSASINIFWY